MTDDLDIPSFMRREPEAGTVTLKKIIAMEGPVAELKAAMQQQKEADMAKKNTDETPGVGHNSGADPDQEKDTLAAAKDTEDAAAGSVGGIAPGILRAYVERVERLEEEKKALSADIREVYAEAKGNGFEPKIIRKVVRLRKMDASDRAEEAELMSLYLRAIGMDPDLADLY